MGKLNKIWQLAIMIILAAVLIPFFNFTKLSLIEYGVLVILGINIIVETIDVCCGLDHDQSCGLDDKQN